jgi:transcriptional antiterminator NusG
MVVVMEDSNQPLGPPLEDSTASPPVEGVQAAPSPVEVPPPVELPPALPEAVPPTRETEPPPAEVPAPVVEQTAPEPATESIGQEPPAEPSDEKAVAEESAVPPPVEAPPPPPVPKSEKMDWYILKVQSNREDSIREGLLRRVAIAGLDYYFGEVIVPMERVTEFKGGKKKIIKRKLYPGYLVVQMEINDDTWFLVRETPGIGDFTGAAGRPTPMHTHEIERILAKTEEKSEKAPKLKIGFREGDHVKIKEGTFESFEGQVETIDQTNGQVTVMINIFGRSTPVTLEYWQIEAL